MLKLATLFGSFNRPNSSISMPSTDNPSDLQMPLSPASKHKQGDDPAQLPFHSSLLNPIWSCLETWLACRSQLFQSHSRAAIASMLACGHLFGACGDNRNAQNLSVAAFFGAFDVMCDPERGPSVVTDCQPAMERMFCGCNCSCLDKSVV
jgi:hypothetical protein